MPARLAGKRIAVLATDGVEQIELTSPWRAAEEAGATLELIAPREGRIQAMNHDDKGETFQVGRTTPGASVEEYDGLLLPGGVANSDRLRTDAAAVSLVRDFVQSGKPVAAICHGPWMLVEADVLADRTLTSWPSLRTDIENAGGHWVDESVHVDQGIVTSRKPDDLPDFNTTMVEQFAVGEQPRRVSAGISAMI